MNFKGHLRELGAGTVFVLVLAIYALNARNDLVRFDDLEYIARNPHIKSGLTPRSIAWALSSVGYAANWHPLTWLSHAADISFARLCKWDWLEKPDGKGRQIARERGAFAQFAHGENVVLHAANAVLLALVIFTLLRFWTGEPISRTHLVVVTVCALLWAVHPLRVEVVSWVSERKELLSAFCMLLTILFYIRTETNTTIFLALFFFALALLAKPVAVSLPMILFGCDVLLRRKDAIRRLVPFALLSIGTCVLTMMAQKVAIEQGETYSVLTRTICAVEAPIIYIRQTFWPFGLAISYPMPETWRSASFVLGGVLIIILLALGVVWLVLKAKKQTSHWSDIIPLSLAWCYIALLPMLGIVKVGYQPHSDRYTYWAGCGVAAILALVVAGTRKYWMSNASRLLMGSLAVAVVLGTFTLFYSSRWHDTKSLMMTAVRSAHLEADAWILSVVLLRSKEMPEKLKAIEMAREVLAIRHSPYARAILAHALAIVGEPDIRVNAITEEAAAFEEVKILVNGAMEEGGLHHDDIALAALAFVEYRERQYAQAFEHIKKAYEGGYESDVLDLKLEDFERKAKEKKNGLEQKK